MPHTSNPTIRSACSLVTRLKLFNSLDKNQMRGEGAQKGEKKKEEGERGEEGQGEHTK